MPTASSLHGSFPFVLEGEDLLEGSLGALDSFTFSVAAEAASWESQLADLDLALRAKLPASFGFHSMWIDNWRVANRSAGVATIAISCLGLSADSDKRKATISLTASRISVGSTDRQPNDGGGDINLNTLTWDAELQQWTVTTAEGVISVLGQSAPAWSFAVSRVTVTEIYFTTTAPDTSEIGKPYTPTVDVTEPVNVYSSELASTLTLRNNYPSGWVLDDRQIEPLFSESSTANDLLTQSGLYAVTDKISYYLPAEPG